MTIQEQTYKVLQNENNTNKKIYSFQEKNNSYFDGLSWKKVSNCTTNILNNVTDISVSKQATRLGNILDYKYLNESSNNDIVNLTKFQFNNNYEIKPSNKYGIGDPNLINYCVSGNKNFFKPNTNGIINSGKFDYYNFNFKFTKTHSNPYYQCENEAITKDVPYFVVGNMKYSQSDPSYDCYVPKNKNSYNTNTIKKLLDPVYNTIKNIFSEQKINNKLSYNHWLDASKNPTLDYYIDDSFNNAIPGVGNYLIYTTDVYNFSNEDVNQDFNPLKNLEKIRLDLDTIKTYQHYRNLYNNDLSLSKMRTFFDNLTTYFPELNCLEITEDTSIEKIPINSHGKLDNTINQIYNQWKLLNNANKNIQENTSTIKIICTDREKYLIDLNRFIENEQNKLKKLLNDSNGGIGRIKDQKYLRDNTIIEINILILIVIFSLFLYSKIK